MAALRRTQQLFDDYDAIASLRNAATNTEQWQRLNAEAQKARRAWMTAVDAATMQSDPDSYKIEQGGTQQ